MKKAKAYVPLEKEVQRDVVAYLHARGCVAVRVNSGAVKATHNGKQRFFRLNSEAGCSDVLACYKGIFVALEVKRPGWKFNPNDQHYLEQRSFIDRVVDCGGVGGFVTSIYDVEKILDWADAAKLGGVTR